jgi:hypothetical protein
MIVLFTDFGVAGPYVGQMKAVISDMAPLLRVIDLMHDAPLCNPEASAYLLAALAPCLPKGTVFVCVVDPGVGSDREAIFVDTDRHRFVGPQNGLLSIVARRAKQVGVRKIEFDRNQVSASFHGRDVFAPAAAQIFCEGGFHGPEFPAQSVMRPDWPDDLAEIIYIDHFGNAITGLRASTIPETAVIEIAGHRLSTARTFSDVAPGAAIWYENSNGLVEVAVNQGRADELGLAIGSPLAILKDASPSTTV